MTKQPELISSIEQHNAEIIQALEELKGMDNNIPDSFIEDCKKQQEETVRALEEMLEL